MDIVYVCEGPGTLPPKRQLDALKAAGFDVSEPLMDRYDERTELGRLVGMSGNPPMVGAESVLRIACEAYLAKGGRARAAILRKLAALGCRVGVLGAEPVLYDDDAKIEEFNRRAAAGALSEAGKATRGAGRGKGRPAHFWPTRSEFKTILRQWRDVRYNASLVIEDVVEMTEANGFERPILETTQRRWDAMRGLFGKREDTDDRRPPARIKAEYPKQE